MAAGHGDTERTYRAFVSYSHADRTFANWLHRKLETYRFPRKFAGGAPLRPIFIDRAELSANQDLSESVRAALSASEALIVVASPHAAASRWVSREVELFRALHPDRPVLVALAHGEPQASLPEALQPPPGSMVEPLAADFRKEGDGQRLALLKLVAGLAGVPLDQLVRRDAQARQRRVIAVTAFALVLSLVLAALLVLAVQARAEAERQRAEAEGMVEFMLTDLRSRLKGVGRLDVMDAVNQRAMVYYGGQKDLEGLPDESLERRARVLHAMGEDHLDTGKNDAAGREFAEAHRTTASLLARDPDNQDRIFAHAQSEYWLGARWFILRKSQRTIPHWQAYRALARRLVALDGKLERNRRELGSAEANLCALALEKPVRARDAKRHCEAASAEIAMLAKARPNDIQAQLDYASQVAWSADAAVAAGDLVAALRQREAQVSFVNALAMRFPANIQIREGQMLAELGLAQALVRDRKVNQARKAATRALEINRKLLAVEPNNLSWKNWNKTIYKQIYNKEI